jgi:transcriptional antiterminator RfaH
MFHKVRFTRGVRSVISFGAGPAQVDDEVINIVRSRVEEDGFVRIRQDLEPGDEVRVKEGPLRDFIGIFERDMNCNDRVMILLKTINYQAHFEIESSLIEKTIKH